LSLNFLRAEHHEVSRSSPEQRLWTAALHDAVKICRGQTPASDDDRRRAIAWFARKSDDVASFDWCCRVIGIEPSAAHACVQGVAKISR
jgi:hypothetical protein